MFIAGHCAVLSFSSAFAMAPSLAFGQGRQRLNTLAASLVSPRQQDGPDLDADRPVFRDYLEGYESDQFNVTLFEASERLGGKVITGRFASCKAAKPAAERDNATGDDIAANTYPPIA